MRFRAEEDARIAQKLAQKYESQATQIVDIESVSPEEFDVSRENMSLLGASCQPSTSASAKCRGNRLEDVNSKSSLSFLEDEEDLKQLQEQQDAVRILREVKN